MRGFQAVLAKYFSMEPTEPMGRFTNATRTDNISAMSTKDEDRRVQGEAHERPARSDIKIGQ
jgi:hypothetical protein